jgi:hypothetical protein
MVRNRLLVRGGGGGGNRQLGRNMRESGSGGGFGGRSGGGSGSGDSGGGGGGGKGGVSNGLEDEVMVGGDDGLGVDGADDGEEDGHVQFLFVFGGYHSASFTPNTDVYALRLTPIPPPPSSSSTTTLNGTQEEVEESTGGVDFEVAADIGDIATVFLSKPLPTAAPLLPVWQRLSVKGAKHSKTQPPASSSSSSSSSASSTSSDFSSTPGSFLFFFFPKFHVSNLYVGCCGVFIFVVSSVFISLFIIILTFFGYFSLLCSHLFTVSLGVSKRF